MHLTLSLQYPYSQVYFTELNSCKRSHNFAVNKNNCALHVLSERGPCSLLNVKWWWRDVSARRKKRKKEKTSTRRRRGLLQGYHEYEHWLHHAIITKLLTVPRRMRGPDSTHLNRCPLPPTGLRLSTYESRPAKDHLTITPVSVTQDQGGCWEKGQGERRAKYLVFCQQSDLK